MFMGTTLYAPSAALEAGMYAAILYNDVMLDSTSGSRTSQTGWAKSISHLFVEKNECRTALPILTEN